MSPRPTPPVPPPLRPGGPYRVALVCLGNICRSPMADVVANALLGQGQSQASGPDLEVSSYGTGDWHVGNPMDERAAAILARAGYDATRHRARQFTRGLEHDLVLAMDADNLATVRRRLPAAQHDRVLLFRAFDPLVSDPPVPDVPDPYYGGEEGFTEVLAMVERTAEALVAALRRDLAG